LQPKSPTRLAIFDFDRTLISRDSFRSFSLASASTLTHKVCALAMAACAKAGFVDNQAYKAHILQRLWYENTRFDREQFITSFCASLRRFENGPVVWQLKHHVAQNDMVAILSASPELYLRPLAQAWSRHIEVFGTRVSYVGERVVVKNLHGERKADCARGLIADRQPSTVWVYTDHIDDLPLIQLATDVRLVSPSPRLVRALRRLHIKFEQFYP